MSRGVISSSKHELEGEGRDNGNAQPSIRPNDFDSFDENQRSGQDRKEQPHVLM
jgi:hypothetical protein